MITLCDQFINLYIAYFQIVEQTIYVYLIPVLSDINCSLFHCRTALAQMLSGETFRSDLKRRFADTDVDRDKNVSIGYFAEKISI